MTTLSKKTHDRLGLDHGTLSGKDDDDHTQYYNATRHTKAVHNALDIAPASHGADKHTDRTRNMWLIPNYGTDGLGIIWEYSGAKLTDGATHSGYATKVSPKDFVSGGVLKAVVISEGSGNLVFYLDAHFAINGGDPAEHDLSTGEITEAIVANKMEVLANTLELTALSNADIIGARFIRGGAEAGDTVDANVFLIGFILEYLGDM